MRLKHFAGAVVLFSWFLSPLTADETHFLFKPCRVLDTRNTSVGLVTAGSTLSFDVRFSNTNSGSQGGESGCYVPDVSSGVVLNLISVAPTLNGHVFMWAADTSVPIASALNVNAGITENDGQLVRLAEYGSANDINIKPAIASSYFVVDLVAWVGAADTTMEKGVIVDKQGNTIPPTITFDIGAARELLCAEPWIDPELCDQYEVDDCIAVTGHVSPSYSFNKMYVHTITGCE